MLPVYLRPSQFVPGHPVIFLRFFFFWCGPFFKLWLNLLQYCFWFFLVFWLWDMWDLRSPTRDWTRTPCIGRQSLNHWTTREVLILVTNTTPITCKIFLVWTINCMNPHQLPCLHTSKAIALNTKYFFFQEMNQSTSEKKSWKFSCCRISMGMINSIKSWGKGEFWIFFSRYHSFLRLKKKFKEWLTSSSRFHH